MSATLERELKLLAPDGFELPAMAGAVPGLHDGEGAEMELDAVYYDTADLALARAGVTLRFRSGDSGPAWTVKLPEGSDGSMLTRRELRFDGDPGTVPPDARDAVRAYLRSGRLRRVARLHTLRRSVPLLGPDGSVAGELVDDLVDTFEGRRKTGAFHEVELELTTTRRAGRLRRAALERLTEAGCVAAPPQPKLIRALGDRAIAPPDLIVKPLSGKPTVADLVSHALAASAERLIRHDPGVRVGEDPEDVHQFRVAARTLRSNLRTFAPVLDGEWATVLRDELGWLGTEAGRVRDLDVLRSRLHRQIVQLPEEDDAGAQLLFDRLGEQADQARTALLATLRSHRYDSILDALIAAAAAPEFTVDHAAPPDGSARRFVRRTARSQVRRLDRTVSHMSPTPTDEQLHLMRIQAKRARYAIEAARPVIGDPAAQHAAALANLQDVLGDYHDATVAVAWLRAAAAAQPRCGLAAGQLIASERSEQSHLRTQVPLAWHVAGSDPLRTWL